MRRLGILFLALFSAVVTAAPARAQERGASAMADALAGLSVSARVLMIGAHPDDEDTQLLAFLARGGHVETAYLSLTRGDGGQNRIGNELGEALGAIRTEELLAARRVDGAQQFFTRAYDFGFSKSASETFEHWPHDSILRDVVTVVRSFRPHVIVAVFSGTAADGHGHHQVAGILAREAFDASADSLRFPASSTPGLGAWAPLKLFQTLRGNAAGATTTINVGEYSAVLGRSFAEIAGESRSQHKSQGFGSLEPRGVRMGYLRLERSRAGAISAAPTSIFEGIDTTWNRFALVMGAAGPVASLRASIQSARQAYDPFEPSTVIPHLAAASEAAGRLCLQTGAQPDCEVTGGTPAIRADLAASNRELVRRINDAIVIASGVIVDATSTREVVAAGEPQEVTTTIYNRGDLPVTIRVRAVRSGNGVSLSMRDTALVIPPDSASERVIEIRASAGNYGPPWLSAPRNGDMFGAPLSVSAAQWGTSALAESRNPGPIVTDVAFEVNGARARISVPVVHRFADPVVGEIARPVAIAPEIALTVDREVEFVEAGAPYDRTVILTVKSASSTGKRVVLTLDLPAGLSADSSRRVVTLPANGTASVQFQVRGQLAAGSFSIGATATSGDVRFTDGYMLVDYPHIRRQRIYQRAAISITALDITIPANLRVAYIRGVGDNMAPVLQRMGVPIVLLSPAEVASADLSRFTTVVVGPRAYDANPELVLQNPRLFDFVRRGGTMVVQFGQNIHAPGVLPYSVSASGNQERVTEEDSPVRILDPGAPLMTAPNRITAVDFNGWVQERATYMPRTRDSAYTPLLAMNDSGEQPLDGGLLVARLGDGVFIYTGLALFRQIPAGVPGAARLMVNLMAAGH